MKFVTVVFWAMVLGQVLGYILSALSSTPNDPILVAGISLFLAILVYILANVMKPKASSK